MANQLEIVFAGGARVTVDATADRLARGHMGPSGLIEFQEINGLHVYVNLDQVAYARDHGPK